MPSSDFFKECNCPAVTCACSRSFLVTWSSVTITSCSRSISGTAQLIVIVLCWRQRCRNRYLVSVSGGLRRAGGQRWTVLEFSTGTGTPALDSKQGEVARWIANVGWLRPAFTCKRSCRASSHIMSSGLLAVAEAAPNAPKGEQKNHMPPVEDAYPGASTAPKIVESPIGEPRPFRVCVIGAGFTGR